MAEDKARRPPVSENLPRNTEYAIHRAPDLNSLAAGAQVRYTADYRFGQPPTAIGGPSSYRDGVCWYKFRQDSLLEETRGKDPNWGRVLEKGPVGQFYWDCLWKNDPGYYVVAAEVRSGRESTFCFVGQQVEPVEAILGRGFEELLHTGTAASPAQAERAIEKHLENLKAIEKRFPIKDPQEKKQHDETIKKWQEDRKALGKLLTPTFLNRRIPVRGLHLETATQRQRPLLLFLAHLWDRKEPLGGTTQRWVLVDWTHPRDPRFHGTYEGEGETAEAAIKSALSNWDWWNRYPKGRLTYEVSDAAFGRPYRREMETNGKDVVEEVVFVLEWIAVGALVVASAGFLFVPVPALVTGAIGTSIVSSTGAATISIAHRWSSGIFDWRADAFDALTIIGNIFAGAGAWSRGAVVKGLTESGEQWTRVFIGAQIGTDFVQGILIVEEHAARYKALTEDPNLLPEERAQKLLELFRSLSLAGLMTYMSLRISATDLDNVQRNSRHIGNEERSRPIREKFDELTDPEAIVDTARPPLTEGTSREGKQKTTARTGTVHRRKPVKPEEAALAQAYPEDSSKWKARVFTEDHILLHDHDDFLFKAHCSKGTLDITIITVKRASNGTKSYSKIKEMRADLLIPGMYEYFESVGNPVTRLEGLWAWENYRVAKAKYDDLLRAGAPEQEAINGAVREAITYKKYHEPRGFTKLVKAEHMPGLKLFSFVFERP